MTKGETMGKIKVSADTVLSILKGIMEDSDINYVIKDVSAPDWMNKTVQDALNVEYYTFRHRPVDSDVVIEELIKQGMPSSELQALTRSFCLLSLTSTERVFSKNNDIVTVSANLEYWIQTDKVKLLEDMFEDIAVETIGERIPVQIGTEDRQAVIALGPLSISEIQETTEYGEMAICEIDIDIILYPNAASITDYKAEFLMQSKDGKTENWVQFPATSISVSTSMTQKAVPFMNQPRDVGNINLSRVKSIVFTCDGYNNEFIDFITDFSLGSDTEVDNNKLFILKLTRKDKSYQYSLNLKEHIISVKEEIGNEVHSLTFTKRGMRNGTS